MAPAEKPSSKPRPAAGAGPQMSLLDVADEPEAPLVSEVGQLPTCTGLEVAVVWPGGMGKAPHVGVEGHDDFRWGGSQEDLCVWLANARRLVTADLKALLIAAACWRKLPVAATPPFFFDLGLAAYLINPEESDYGWPRLAVRWGAPLRDGQGNNGPASMALRMAALMEQRLEADGLLELQVLFTARHIQLMNGEGRVDFGQLVQVVGMVRIPAAGDDLVITAQAGVGQGKTNAPIGTGNQDGLTHMASLSDGGLAPSVSGGYRWRGITDRLQVKA